jgi:hypothetical protein
MARQTTYPPLNEVQRERLKTAPAAYYLQKSEDTLRKWRMDGSGPRELNPIKVGHHLLWSTAEIKALLGVQA